MLCGQAIHDARIAVVQVGGEVVEVDDRHGLLFAESPVGELDPVGRCDELGGDCCVGGERSRFHSCFCCSTCCGLWHLDHDLPFRSTGLDVGQCLSLIHI